MIFSKSKTHNKRKIHWNQFKAVAISTITLTTLELIDSGEYDWVEALYFENAESSWQQDNCEYLYTVEHHRFYK